MPSLRFDAFIPVPTAYDRDHAPHAHREKCSADFRKGHGLRAQRRVGSYRQWNRKTVKSMDASARIMS